MRKISGERMWRNEKKRVRQVSALLRLEPEIVAELTKCRFEVGFFIRITRENGKEEHITGWRIQHCNPYDTGRRPYKGGFMRAMSVGRDLLRTKASLMTWKCALAGPMENEAERVPFGGAKGGLRCDPETYSSRETKQQMEKTAEALSEFIGPTRDSLGPDVAVGPEEIRHFVTRYSALNKGRGIPCGAVATGKPLDNAGGGCSGRLLATGRGLHFVLRELRENHPHLKNFPKNPRAIVQGFGNVGSAFALLAEEFGITIIGVSDIRGSIYNRNGINVHDLVAFSRETGSVKGYPGGEPLNKEELILQECDVLVPAATENVITTGNADQIRALLVLEGANAPTTAEADVILRRRGVLVAPDILANAGGVVVSYFEWCQDTQGKFWTEQQINTELERFMIGGVRRTMREEQKFNADLRAGAYLGAISYCAPALRKKHGWKKSSKSLV